MYMELTTTQRMTMQGMDGLLSSACLSLQKDIILTFNLKFQS